MTSACLRGKGCPHVPLVKRSQYIRIENPLHKHFAGMPMVGGEGSEIEKICRRLKWMVPKHCKIFRLQPEKIYRLTDPGKNARLDHFTGID